MLRAEWEAFNSNLKLGNHVSIFLKTEENHENHGPSGTILSSSQQSA
jgi:hypothetical protein